MNKKRYIVLMSVLCFNAFLLSACEKLQSWLPKQVVDNEGHMNKQVGKQYTAPTQSPQMALPDFTQLVEKEGSAVVNIQASGQQEDRGDDLESLFDGREGHASPDPFLDFFRQIIPEIRPRTPQESRSFGSGFILSEDGYVLTNAHVVQGSKKIKVTLTDKRDFPARLIGSDKRTDVALLKIEAKSLPHVRIGDPAQLKVGEWVAAIGAPFGFENSVTAGIVSAKGRNLPDDTLVPFIQTDVAINPGNSGGPLFNLRGEVVGINSQIYSRSGGFMGISFAIPIDVAQQVVEQLKSKGKVIRGQLGIIIQDFSPDLAKSFGANNIKGALVASIAPGSPAERSGIRSGDIIIKFNDQQLNDSRDLPRLVAAYPPGTQVKLEVWRNNQILRMSITLSEQDSTDEGGSLPERSSGSILGLTQFDRLGLAVSDLDSETKRKIGLSQGVLIRKVSTRAVRMGFRTGDVIIGLNQQAIVDVKQLNSALSSSGNAFALLIRRDSQTLYVPVKLDENSEG
jgi:serine protease Do